MMDKSDAEVEVALPMGSSAGEKTPTGKGAAKKATAGKKGTAAMNNTAEKMGKVIGEVNISEEKQKILMENGIEVTGDDIEPA